MSCRVAFLGLGRIASLLEDDTKREKPASHAGAFSAVPGTVLAGGWDPEPDRRRAFTERWTAPTEFQDPADLLGSLKPDIVVIATPPDSHAELVLLARPGRVPVVVCEKPLTADLAEARKLARRVAGLPTRGDGQPRAAVRPGLPAGPVADRGPDLRRAEIGGGQAVHGPGPDSGRGDALGRHPPDRHPSVPHWRRGRGRVTAWGRPAEKGARLTARFLMGPAEVFVETAADRDHLVFELDLGFDRGRVRIGNGLYEEFIGGPSPLYDKMRSLLPVAVPAEELYPTGYFSGMAADAVRTAGDPEYPPVSTLNDGLAALETIDRVLRAAGSSLKAITQLS